MTDDQYVKLLKRFGTDKILNWEKRPLLHHLIATHDLLKSWGACKEVCVGGLFHSIYGTQLLETRAAGFESRDELRRVIGDKAENLAYSFCVMDRWHFYGSLGHSPLVLMDRLQRVPIPVDKDLACYLLDIAVANVVDHLAFGNSGDERDILLASTTRAALMMSTAARRALSTAVPHLSCLADRR